MNMLTRYLFADCPRPWEIPQSVGGEPGGTAVLSDDLELKAQESGGSNVGGGGVRSIVAVLDDGQEMDRCSCDLVKVSLILHRREN